MLTYEIREVGKKLQKQHIEIIEQNHYSKTAKSQKPIHIFELIYKNKLVGLALFGQPMSRHSFNKYGEKTIELRRFVLIPGLPKNTATWFISRCLQFIKHQTNFTKVLSYADPNFGHEGIIYKASNFQYLGKSKESNPRIVKFNDKLIHIRDYYSKSVHGGYSKRAKTLQKLVKEGKAQILTRLQKHVFLYDLKKVG